MDDLDRPPLDPFIYEEIEQKLHKLETAYWSALCEMRFGHSLARNSGG